MIDLFDNQDDIPFCQYLADTEQGSSGSPVYNDQWEIIALHHQAVPQTNAKGEMVDAAGEVIRKGGDQGRIIWIANEGIRVSRLVGHIGANLPPAPAMVPLRDALLALWRENSAQAAQLAAVDDRRSELVARDERAPAVRDLLPGAVAGSVTFTVPLRITVDLGPAVTGRNDAGGR